MKADFLSASLSKKNIEEVYKCRLIIKAKTTKQEFRVKLEITGETKHTTAKQQNRHHWELK